MFLRSLLPSDYRPLSSVVRWNGPWVRRTMGIRLMYDVFILVVMAAVPVALHLYFRFSKETRHLCS